MGKAESGQDCVTELGIRYQENDYRAERKVFEDYCLTIRLSDLRTKKFDQLQHFASGKISRPVA